MNTVLLKINSYAQTAQMFINGQEPSVYSEMANFSYSQYIQAPDEILDAVARELNDDFALSVLGNTFEVLLFREAARRSDYCTDYCAAEKPFEYPSQERAERLGDLLPAQRLSVYVEGIPAFESVQYGNLSLFITNEPAEGIISVMHKGNAVVFTCGNMKTVLPYEICSRDIVISVCETLLVNPKIGQAVSNVHDPSPEIAVCRCLEPVVTAELPKVIEYGQKEILPVMSHPVGCKEPMVFIISSNPDVVVVDGRTLLASAPGTTTIRAFISGENTPFFIQDVTVTKTIRANEIKILGLDNVLNEGAVIPLRALVLPADAVDAKELTWESSDPTVTEIKDGYLHANGAGSCIIKASASCISAEKTVTVSPKLRQLKISDSDISTSVGRKAPITVRCFPANAYNTDYIWESSDESVAVVEMVDGQEYIKAVGIGDCTLTCTSSDGSVFDACHASVKSMMYNSEKNAFSSPASIAIFVVLAYLIFRILFG